MREQSSTRGVVVYIYVVPPENGFLYEQETETGKRWAPLRYENSSLLRDQNHRRT